MKVARIHTRNVVLAALIMRDRHVGSLLVAGNEQFELGTAPPL